MYHVVSDNKTMTLVVKDWDEQHSAAMGVEVLAEFETQAECETYLAGPQPGEEVSHATLRDQDLLKAMTDALRKYGGRKYAALLEEAEEVLKQIKDTDREYVGWLINEGLVDALSDLAPDGCYFGAHEGDGSLIGWWPIQDVFGFGEHAYHEED